MLMMALIMSRTGIIKTLSTALNSYAELYTDYEYRVGLSVGEKLKSYILIH